MSARECSACDMCFPNHVLNCPVCDKILHFYSAKEPTEDWASKVREMKALAAADALKELPLLDSEVVKAFRKWHVIAAKALEIMYPDAMVGSIVAVDGITEPLYFELDYLVNADGVIGWVVRRVDWRGWVPDAPPSE